MPRSPIATGNLPSSRRRRRACGWPGSTSVLECAEAGRFATPTAPRPASARDSPWGQDTSVRLSFG